MLTRYYFLKIDGETCYVVDPLKEMPEGRSDIRYQVVAVTSMGHAQRLKRMSDADVAECYRLLM